MKRLSRTAVCAMIFCVTACSNYTDSGCVLLVKPQYTENDINVISNDLRGYLVDQLTIGEEFCGW